MVTYCKGPFLLPRHQPNWKNPFSRQTRHKTICAGAAPLGSFSQSQGRESASGPSEENRPLQAAPSRLSYEPSLQSRGSKNWLHIGAGNERQLPKVKSKCLGRVVPMKCQHNWIKWDRHCCKEERQEGRKDRGRDKGNRDIVQTCYELKYNLRNRLASLCCAPYRHMEYGKVTIQRHWG